MPLPALPGDHRLRVTGEVSIQPCYYVLKRSCRILIMGPTGAGKSSFVEALAGASKNSLNGISRDQLEGFTQDVSAYELRNAVAHSGGIIRSKSDASMPIYVIDSPGFSDRKISELEIIMKIKKWMSDYGVQFIDHVLYLFPITLTRVSGSRRRTFEMIQSLVNPHSNSRYTLTVVTTMWDNLSNAGAQTRAESSYEQLRDESWKLHMTRGSKITRFQNTQASALEIVRDAIDRVSFTVSSMPINRYERFVPLLYNELLERITALKQDKARLLSEHFDLYTNPNVELQAVLDGLLEENNVLLSKFMAQISDFGEPPSEFEGYHMKVLYQDLIDHVLEEKQKVQKLTQSLATLKDLDHVDHPDADHILRLEKELQEALQNKRACLSSLARYGDPPPGFEGVVGNLLPWTALSLKGFSNNSKISMSTTVMRYGELTVEDPVLVEALPPGFAFAEDTPFFILTGETGSGKSAFIESLCPHRKLSISSNELDTVTQSIKAYRIVNVFWNRRTVVIVDTPGFLGESVSDWQVATQVQEFIQSIQKLEALRLFKMLVGGASASMGNTMVSAASKVTIITTMWDTLARKDQIDAANIRHEHLRENEFQVSFSPAIQLSFSVC
ncbi:hypothetical protein CVT24_013091 [Panaeolus cyanescens]|uniref:AAA+ ATPase domain-containing protein n=1 Tax=Panaeolus cyanescens TaxID=181874 RepID=A0A409WR11_9AGAR|nr:hypothetical protein CVT24_013091 [Panaeolus cyanescens]